MPKTITQSCLLLAPSICVASVAGVVADLARLDCDLRERRGDFPVPDKPRFCREWNTMRVVTRGGGDPAVESRFAGICGDCPRRLPA